MITVNEKGRIGFNKPARELMALDAGSVIDFYEDEEDPGVYYLAHSKDGKTIRQSADGNCYFIQNSALVKKLLADWAPKAKTLRVMVAGKPTTYNKMTYFGLIPKPAL